MHTEDMIVLHSARGVWDSQTRMQWRPSPYFYLYLWTIRIMYTVDSNKISADNLGERLLGLLYM